MKHLLVTNDFPPKVGGIQNYLWELWRRLPSDEFAVLTTPHRGASVWDAQQSFEVIRSKHRWLLPTPPVLHEIVRVAREQSAQFLVLDPALPLGDLGPRLQQELGIKYALVLHGAEVTVPARLRVLRPRLARTLSNASLLIAAGDYPKAEAQYAAQNLHLPPIVRITPGVDTDRFVPISETSRAAVRQRFDIAQDAPLVVSVSRLVPRKGMDTLIRAAANLRADMPKLRVVIAGQGRDSRRLAKLVARTRAPVDLLGRIDDADVASLIASADVFAMLCRNRWGALEQEGFGIVFAEAAAAGVASLAGASGGAAEAVVNNETGLIVDDPKDVTAVTAALRLLLNDSDLRRTMGDVARKRAVDLFTYDHLVTDLRKALETLGGQDD